MKRLSFRELFLSIGLLYFLAASSGETETIVTTKLGLGGLDINILEMEADLVINFDMPKDITDFQLRGR